MLLEKIDLYLFLHETCELYAEKVGGFNDSWNSNLLSRILGEDPGLRWGEIWINIPGRILGEKIFIDYLYALSRLCEAELIESVTIQCNAESIVIKPEERIYQRFKISLVVCDNPDCGVDRPKKIISNILLAQSIFKSVSFVGPSPAECILGLDAGTKIRRKCLFGKNLFFLMGDYSIQRCPLSQLSIVGSLKNESMVKILERALSTMIEFSTEPIEADCNMNINICLECKKGKMYVR